MKKAQLKKCKLCLWGKSQHSSDSTEYLEDLHPHNTFNDSAKTASVTKPHKHLCVFLNLHQSLECALTVLTIKPRVTAIDSTFIYKRFPKHAPLPYR